jgi:acetylornithine deacetylase/succinyl-diaminopimelate desuccinylase-like protein
MGDQRPVSERAAELIREALKQVGLDAIKRGITPHHFRRNVERHSSTTSLPRP